MEQKTDLRILRTHKSLCDAFIVMLEEMNFENITVDELCKRAMIRRPTFYKHFSDKYDFFAFFIRRIHDEYVSEGKEKQNTDDNSFYAYLFKQGIHFFKEHDKLIKHIFASNMLPTLLDIFSDEVYRGILLKLKDDETAGKQLPVSAETLASFYTGGIVRLLRFWSTDCTPETEEKLIQEFETIFSLVP